MHKRPYQFKMFSDESLRTINQTGVRTIINSEYPTYTDCWDSNIAPDGTLYFAPADETGNGRHTRLLAYDYTTNTIKTCFKAEDYILPTKRQFPICKLHESITFLPDGRVFATTHSTDRPPHHPEWLPYAHYSHTWEGWAGSHMLVYDPKTGKTENLGMVTPRESIYGATYDAKYNNIYMIGFMRGHIYKYSLDDKTVTDLGKAAEVFCFRLHVGPDQHIYGITKSGFLFRINVDTCELEDLNWRVPEYPDNYCNNTWYRYMSNAVNVGNKIIMATFCGDEFFEYDCYTQEVTPIGRKSPFEELFDFMPTTQAVNDIAIDKYGVLWYVIATSAFQKPADDYRVYKLPNYLIRWDYKNGKKPECLGAIANENFGMRHCSGIHVDHKYDILYAVDAPHMDEVPVSIFAIDLAKFRPHMYENGPVCKDKGFQPRDMTQEEIEEVKRRGGALEEIAVENPFIAFPIENIKPIRIWRNVPHTNIEDSKVIGLVWDDDNVLHGLCGEKNKYIFKIKKGEVESFASFDKADEDYKKWIHDNILPKSYPKIEGIKLPYVAGRQFMAVETAQIAWNNGRKIVGTKDGLLAIVDDSEVYNLGNVAPYGPVRALCTNENKTKLWGTAGDENDLGTVFYYDDEVGIRQLGFLIYNMPGYIDGPSASNILSSIAISKDEKFIAVGGADRMGSIHIARID